MVNISSRYREVWLHMSMRSYGIAFVKVGHKIFFSSCNICDDYNMHTRHAYSSYRFCTRFLPILQYMMLILSLLCTKAD